MTAGQLEGRRCQLLLADKATVWVPWGTGALWSLLLWVRVRDDLVVLLCEGQEGGVRWVGWVRVPLGFPASGRSRPLAGPPSALLKNDRMSR